MPKIKLKPIIISITTALIFFALGRIMLLQMGTFGIVIAIALVVIFYIIWGVSYRRGKKK